MPRIDYPGLYALQDQVLRTVFPEAGGFYLSGGTALSRFYMNHRYSDDLDFFTQEIHAFPDAFRLLHEKIRSRWKEVALEIDARDFKRCVVVDGKLALKLDFIADRVVRIGLPSSIQDIRVDTVRNILSNKICAILGRDEGRDVADLVWISRTRRFTWPEVLAEARRKEGFESADLLYRLSSFPIDLLDSVPFIDAYDKLDFEHALRTIGHDIDAQGENTLAQADALPL
ncbi:MAG: nucleotidyl transferase AbiEii/AbiGii toxin family protein [Spirochaetaceae bacterium]|nr:nucleotidyl transferase AbiEii/AbiGii toxin family protein [Spirochaetaceae bacterium]